jgi:endonuclease/exonuclease/phosphatase family metal-dependent hydrolase
MSDIDFVSEARWVREVIAPYPTLRELRAAAVWAGIERRVGAVLATVRRHDGGAPAASTRDPSRVRAVHWNIEHGNWYEQVERALLDDEALRDADLLMFNEIDFGMARAGNRDVTRDLAVALGRHAVWAPLFIETTLGRDDDPRMAAGGENRESLFGLAILSRWPIGEVRVIELPSPEAIQFDLERMLGRHIALVATIERPGAPFVAVSVHLEVHRTRAHRAAQMRVLGEALRGETRPVLLAGDFNSHTFDRGVPLATLRGATALLLTPGAALARRLRWPDRGPHHETLFDELRAARFEWERFVDHEPTLDLRFDRIDEARTLPAPLRGAGERVLRWAESRARLRLDWFAGRGWSSGAGRTVPGLDGPGRASDHAPLVAEFL